MDGNTACRERLSPELDVVFPELDIRKGDTLGNVRRFRRALKALRPATLITSNFGSIEWAIANAVPVARHVHIEDGFGPEERGTQIPRRVWLRRLFLQHSTVVLPSRVLWRIAAETWRLPMKRLRYVPNGIPLAAFRTPDAMAFAGSGLVVGTVAALRAEKNLPRLLRAFRLVADDMVVRLVVVGDGPERAGLETLAAELGIAGMVQFTGHLARPQHAYGGFGGFRVFAEHD